MTRNEEDKAFTEQLKKENQELNEKLKEHINIKDFGTFYDGKENKYYLCLHCFKGIFTWSCKIVISKGDYYVVNRMLGNIETCEKLMSFLEKEEKNDK